MFTVFSTFLKVNILMLILQRRKLRFRRVKYLSESTQQKRRKGRIELGVCKTPNPAALTLFYPLGAEP